ncbi:transporter substrate-binding domain-containing protein [Pseudomonas sp. ABC1]|uniref:substrate-binding periplasmic protein n=1 Tax=Pseudomonas sp. ABC1 TaxID=2748080 RepID=UPI00211A7A0A
MDSLQQTNRVVLESAGQLQGRLERLAGLGRRATDLGEAAAHGCEGAGSPAPALERLLRQQGLPLQRDYDRLADILQRKRIRIAIEPAFIGLSFRRRAGEPLQGLDADYARAFAKWLGVELEFVEQGWEECLSALAFGRAPGEAPADLIWSALPASPAFPGLAFSLPYSSCPLILARRRGDTAIRSLGDLQGKVLGCGNDPQALQVLEQLGVRWAANRQVAGGRIELANLIAFSDQSRIHDGLAEGIVDAFAVERPIYHWACTDTQSPWHGRLEILPVHLGEQRWCYSAGVAARGENASLLEQVDAFVHAFRDSPQRAAIERRWQGVVSALEDAPLPAGVPGTVALLASRSGQERSGTDA